MRYLYSIHGRNVGGWQWGLTRRRQGRQVRWCLDCGPVWFAAYFMGGSVS